MESLNNRIKEYKAAMQKGDIPRAYRGIIDFMLILRTHFRNNYPELSVSGNFYQGYMDITFFTLVPVFLSDRKLKIILLFNHERITFEAWLSGVNKQVQEKYLELFRKGNWDNCRVAHSAEGSDSILESDLVTSPDFDHPETLIKQIEQGVWKFIGEVEHILFRSGQ